MLTLTVITETALTWFKSYLSEHSQIINVGMRCEVSHGSVLVPILFTI